MTHHSRGCFFVYAFKFAWGHWCLIKFPHWDKQVIFKRKECGRFGAKDAAFLMSYFFLPLLFLPSFEIVESGSCFCLEVLSPGEDSCLVNECDSCCLRVCMWRKQWLDVACPVLTVWVSMSNSVFPLRLLELRCRSRSQYASLFGE